MSTIGGAASKYSIDHVRGTYVRTCTCYLYGLSVVNDLNPRLYVVCMHSGNLLYVCMYVCMYVVCDDNRETVIGGLIQTTVEYKLLPHGPRVTCTLLYCGVCII